MQGEVRKLLGSRPPKRESASGELPLVTSTCARKLPTLCRQNDAVVGVTSGSPSNQTDDTRKVRQVCQTCGATAVTVRRAVRAEAAAFTRQEAHIFAAR